MPLSLLPTGRRTRVQTSKLVEKGSKDAYPQASKRQQAVSATQCLDETGGN